MSTNNSQGQLSGDSPSSKIDLFSGKHTTSLIVAALFLIVFIGLIIYLILKDNYENIILNGMFSFKLIRGFSQDQI